MKLKKSFNFGKWVQLSENNPMKNTGGIIENGAVQTSFEVYVTSELAKREGSEQPNDRL